jgi:hypothetical protein
VAARSHVDLFVEGAKPGRTQPVEVEHLGEGLLRVQCSPGLVEGIAAGDTIRVTGSDGRFEVVERGGNLSIKVFSRGPVAAIRDHIERGLAPLGGCCDGNIDRAAVFTVPVRAGFERIERVMAAAVATHPDCEWYFGNVYADDGVTPLGWWDASRNR